MYKPFDVRIASYFESSYLEKCTLLNTTTDYIEDESTDDEETNEEHGGPDNKGDRPCPSPLITSTLRDVLTVLGSTFTTSFRAETWLFIPGMPRPKVRLEFAKQVNSAGPLSGQRVVYC